MSDLLHVHLMRTTKPNVAYLLIAALICTKGLTVDIMMSCHDNFNCFFSTG